MRGAIASVERHVLRGRGIASWILIAVLALSAGTTMALVAGGRRAATSYDRLIAWTDGDDAQFFGLGVTCDGECGSAQADDYLTLGASLPQVESSERSLVIGYGVITPTGKQLLGVSITPVVIGLDATNRQPFSEQRLKVLDGRVFSETAADEALIGFDVAERFDLAVGDTLGIIVDYESELTEDVVITGIVAHPGTFPSFSGPVDPIVILTPAFADRHPELIDWTNAGLSVKLRGGASDLEAFRTAVADAGIPVLGVDALAEQASGPRQLVRFDAGVLWLLATVLGLGSLVVIAQMLRRAAIAVSSELVALRALGMRRADFMRAAVRGGVRTGAIGALGGAGVAIAGSPLFPVGISRTAEPHPGVSVDLLVLALGASAIVLATTLLTCAATLLATRRAATNPEERAGLATVATRLPPAPAAGVRLALSPASVGPGATLRVGLLGLGSILAILVGALSLAASLDRAISDPRLAGGTWDGALIYEDPITRESAGQALASDSRVESFALGGWTSVGAIPAIFVNGREVFTQILDTDAGIDIATDRGREPHAANEIALGEAELDALGVDVGDEVQVAIEGGSSQTATVVGRAVLASPRYRALRQGEGAAVTPEFMSRLGIEDAVFAYVVRFRDDSSASASTQELWGELSADFAFARPDRTGVQSLRDVRTTINAVLVVLGGLAVAALLHRLVVTSRSQQRQIAVLRAMGLTGRQVLSAGAITGLVVAALASLIAVPIGIGAGVLGWRAIADYLGVVPVSLVPALQLVVVLVGLIAAGIATGFVVVGRLRRPRPGSLLRTE